MTDQYITLNEAAQSVGVSESFLRAACRRIKGHHVLPHINCGSSKRPHIKVRPSVVQEWLTEEEAMTC